jgi:glyoxylase-like metal-dependent hydrolase (beta-lactamase superfamily II)
MIQIETFVLGPVMTNCYLLYKENKGIVIDAGMNPKALIERIEQLSLEIEAILLTHAHFDHIGGLEELRDKTKAPVYLHQAETDWLSDPLKNGSGRWPVLPEVVCRPAEKILTGGETLQLLDESFSVIHTPGHSPGSVSYLWKDKIFSGDVLFYDSIGRTDLYGGDHDTLIQTIRSKLFPLPLETVVYPGHGSETTIGREKAHNPYLR